MALLHFAFGKHFREGRLDNQIQETCQMILGPRKLRGGSCPEFLPQLTNAGSLRAVPGSGQLVPNGALTFPQMVASPKVGLLPCDKWMLCFTDIPLNKLANWPAIAHYGQLAIAFQKSFQNRLGIKRVQYYELNRLHTDRKVIAYNQAQGSKAVQELANELLMFRKPKKQWPEFRKLYGMTKISAGPSGVTSEVIPTCADADSDLGFPSG
ncbi:MAG: hypothetical protein CFE36_14300 [Sphingomonadaceae bacterium PASS1]|nr:MAG: hypothetical protein CFE36_14300 [Sphingomonadaceae bacterium PASS1]